MKMTIDDVPARVFSDACVIAADTGRSKEDVLRDWGYDIIPAEKGKGD